jgi:CYTH domain-containing protein
VAEWGIAMSISRRFLVASSLARLIMREQSGTPFVEGHFPASDDRLSYVLFQGTGCQLVLVTEPGADGEEEERANVPTKQGEFLMEVCAGRLAYQRCLLEMGGQQAHLESFRIPDRLHLIEVQLDGPDQARSFAPPLWFGPEVSGDVAYEHNAIATNGPPDQPEIALSDDAINALLDLLDQPEGQQEAIQQEVARGVVEFPKRARDEFFTAVMQGCEQLSAEKGDR